MNNRGEPIDIDQVRHVVTQRWRSGDPLHWAQRTVEIGQIVDVRWYVRLVDGASHTRAYETQEDAEQVAHQIRATPDRMREHPPWQQTTDDTVRPEQ